MSILNSYRNEMYQRIHVTLEFNDRLLGGQPKDPQMIEGWLRANMGLKNSDEMFLRMRQHMIEVGIEGAAEAATHEELIGLGVALGTDMKTQVFKRDPLGNPYIESRQVKAAIKECVNILWGSERWGATRKGVKGYTAERVFVKPDMILVGAPEDVTVMPMVGHVSGPQGERSTLGMFEYVVQPSVEFHILQLVGQAKVNSDEPALTQDQWCRLFAHMELNGLGATRSQGYGQFEVSQLDFSETAERERSRV